MVSSFSKVIRHFLSFGLDAITWSSGSIDAVISGARRVRYVEYTSRRISFISNIARLRLALQHRLFRTIKTAEDSLLAYAPSTPRREGEEELVPLHRGRNSFGSGQTASSNRCTVYDWQLTIVPPGRWTPSRTRPSGGTTRGRLIGVGPNTRRPSLITASR